jgi:acetyl-CoA C-acetyltransferase
MGEAATRALDEAGVGLDDVSFIDFYSCFPVAVEMACDMLGLDEDDPRGFTVTGGLPYAGGPGNNYTLHALATMVDRVRSQPGSKGLCTGNGWYMTKHSATVVSTEPRPGNAWPAAREQRSFEIPEDTRSTAPADGAATLESYTVVYDRDGAPARGIVIGRTDGGRRFLANTPDDRSLLESFVREDPHGRGGRVTARDGHNVFEPA